MSDFMGTLPVLAQRLQRCLIQHVAHAWEARCAWQVSHELSNFALGAEGAPYDCGIVTSLNGEDTSQLSDHRDMSKSLYQILYESRGKHHMYPMDFKTFRPNIPSGRGRGLFVYKFGYYPIDQANCIAFIVLNPAAPHLVALIPKFYLENWTNKEGKQHEFSTKTIPISEIPILQFPPEWTPFVLLMHLLNVALKCFHDFAEGKTSEWTNPHNRVVFKNHPRPIPQDASLLFPAARNNQQDYKTVREIWLAFQHPCARYTVERLVTQPSVGDFVFKHIESEIRVTVELKHGLAKINSAGDLVHSPFLFDASLPHFTSLTAWDILGTVMQNTIVFLSRDELPLNWFSGRTDQDLVLGMSRETLKKHTAFWPAAQDPSLFRLELERILDMIRDNGMWPAQRRLLLVLLPPYQVEALLPQDREGVLNTPQGAEVREWTYKSGRPGTKLWNVEQMIWLRRQCAKQLVAFVHPNEDERFVLTTSRNYGNIFPLGKHPSASHVFIPGPYDPQEQLSDLSPTQPMVFINFVPTDHLKPSLFDHQSLRSATMGLSRSIFILVATPQSLTHLDLNRYLVPSEEFATLARIEYNRKRLDEVSCRKDTPLDIYLRDGRTHEEFVCAAIEIPLQLGRICEAPFYATTIPWIDQLGHKGATIKVSEYLTNLTEALQQHIDQYIGLGYFSVIHHRTLKRRNESRALKLLSRDPTEPRACGRKRKPWLRRQTVGKATMDESWEVILLDNGEVRTDGVALEPSASTTKDVSDDEGGSSTDGGEVSSSSSDTDCED